MDKYPVNLWWSAEDDCFLASMPDLPGCMADGRSQEEALANLWEVAQEWIEIAVQRGREIPQPRALVLHS